MPELMKGVPPSALFFNPEPGTPSSPGSNVARRMMAPHLHDGKTILSARDVSSLISPFLSQLGKWSGDPSSIPEYFSPFHLAGSEHTAQWTSAIHRQTRADLDRIARGAFTDEDTVSGGDVYTIGQLYNRMLLMQRFEDGFPRDIRETTMIAFENKLAALDPKDLRMLMAVASATYDFAATLECILHPTSQEYAYLQDQRSVMRQIHERASEHLLKQLRIKE